MNKLFSLLIFCIILGVVAISGCTDSNNQTGNNSSDLGPNEVALQNFAYSPATLTVKAGTTVKWINLDSATHDVISDDGTFNSGNMGKDQSFNHTFNKAGTYSYHCSFHPSMTGKIIVN